MRSSDLNRGIMIVLTASAAMLLASCGSHDSSNSSNGSGGSANSNSGGGGGADSFDSAAKNGDYGDNNMDSNVAQTDTANSTTASGKQ